MLIGADPGKMQLTASAKNYDFETGSGVSLQERRNYQLSNLLDHHDRC